MRYALALDLETTGLIKSETDDPTLQPGVVEVGISMIKLPSLKKFHNQSWLIKPDQFYEEEAQKISGISEADVAKCPSFYEVFSEIASSFMGVEMMLTFNGPTFDIPVLDYQLRRLNLHTKFPWPPVQYDVMTIGREVMSMKGKSDVKNPKLIELYQYLFDKEFDGQHRAAEDAEATLDCWLELKKQGWAI